MTIQQLKFLRYRMQKLVVESSMKTRMMAAAIAALMGATAVADEVDPAAITEFQSGQPALAAEVNANFNALISSINDNDSRLDALEAVVSMPAISQQITVDCDADAAALANAIASGSLSVGLDITASGTCDAVLIDRDHVSITGPAIINSNASGDDSVAVSNATNVFLNNLTIDGEGIAETALSVRYSSSVVATDVVIQGGADTTTWVQFSSSLRLDGTNSISSAERIALEASGNAIVLATGATTLSSSDRPLILAAGGIAAGGLDISGGEIVIEINSTMFMNGSINVGTVIVDRNSSLNMDADGDNLVINADINAFSYSVVLMDTRDGGTVTHAGNIDLNTSRMAALGPAGTNDTITIGIPSGAEGVFPKVRVVGGSYFVNGAGTVASDEIEIRFNSTVAFLGAGTLNGFVDLLLGASFFGFTSAEINPGVFECGDLGEQYAFLGAVDYCVTEGGGGGVL